MSFDGTWDLTVNSPMGAKAFRIAVTTGDGTVAGTVSADGQSTPLVDARLEEGHLRGSLRLPRPMNIMLDLDLTCDGDSLSGQAKAGHMVLPGITGVRVSS